MGVAQAADQKFISLVFNEVSDWHVCKVFLLENIEHCSRSLAIFLLKEDKTSLVCYGKLAAPCEEPGLAAVFELYLVKMRQWMHRVVVHVVVDTAILTH